MPPAAPERRLSLLLVVLFCAALAVHFVFATRNWHYRFMAGHEFRQTQTALIAEYIAKENNFSLDYTVPLLGKPWVLPLEFPLYEWGVVALSRATHLPQFEAARAISLASFYLTLPALFLLLGQLGLARPRRLFVLACALVCPVYLFYARAVLIDPLALLCSVWFLAAFSRLLRDRHWGWLLLVILSGTAAGLIKSLIWFVWVLPAAGYGAWRLWRSWREGGNRAALTTALWGLGAMVVPTAAALWWSQRTDAIKAAHPSAYIFTSHNLAHDNYGTFSLAAHFSGETWRNLLGCWQQSLLPPWAFALTVAAGLLFLPPWRTRIAVATALFLAAQMTIPLAYAFQDYYFYAANLFAVVAVAFVFLGLLESRLPRWLSAALMVVPLAAFFASYRAEYFQLQSVRSLGGSGLTEAIRTLTPPKSVIIVVGADWSPIIPYYSERRALLIRRGLENDSAYLDRALADLAGEDVSALILTGDQRGNHRLALRIGERLGLDPEITFSHATADVYVAKFYRDTVIDWLNRPHGFEQVSTTRQPAPKSSGPTPTAVTPEIGRTLFAMVSPAPCRVQATHGTPLLEFENGHVLSAHPDSDLWVPPPAGATRIACEFGLLPGAYLGESRTNGVEFLVLGQLADGSTRELFRRVLQPADHEADRGVQTTAFDYQPRAGETIVFRTRDNGHPAFDWAFWRRIEIK